MRSVFEILELLEATSKTLIKEEILRASADNEMLPGFIYMAKDDRFKFNVKKITFAQGAFGILLISMEDRWKYFCVMAYKLQNGELSGGAALYEINWFLNQCPELERKWYTRCIQKDLASIKLSTKSVNKVWPDLLLDYDVMLAEPEDKLPKAKEPGYVELKGNGIRTNFHTNDEGRVWASSCLLHLPVGRSGLPLEQFVFLNEFVEALGLKGWVLDGETHCNHNLSHIQTIMGFDPNKTEDDFRGKTGKVGSGWKKHLEDIERVEPLKAQTKFVVFAMLTREEWDTKTCELNYVQMRERINEVLLPAIQNAGVGHRIEVSRATFAPTKVDAVEIAQRFIAQDLEGGIYKEADGPGYEWRRSVSWVKIKEEVDFDVVVIDIIPSDPVYNGDGTLKPPMVGKFVVTDGQRTFEVGTGKGWTHDAKIKMLEEKESYMDAVMQGTAQKLTEDSAICPRFGYWRTDKRREDILP